MFSLILLAGSVGQFSVEAAREPRGGPSGYVVEVGEAPAIVRPTSQEAAREPRGADLRSILEGYTVERARLLAALEAANLRASAAERRAAPPPRSFPETNATTPDVDAATFTPQSPPGPSPGPTVQYDQPIAYTYTIPTPTVYSGVPLSYSGVSSGVVCGSSGCYPVAAPGSRRGLFGRVR